MLSLPTCADWTSPNITALAAFTTGLLLLWEWLAASFRIHHRESPNSCRKKGVLTSALDSTHICTVLLKLQDACPTSRCGTAKRKLFTDFTHVLIVELDSTRRDQPYEFALGMYVYEIV